MAHSLSRGEVAAFQGPFASPAARTRRIRISSLAVISLFWLATYFVAIFSPDLFDDVDTIHVNRELGQ